jgi:hypothetical protein
MIVNQNKFFSFLLAVVVLSQLYMASFGIKMGIQFVVLITVLFLQKQTTISIGYFKKLLPLFLIICIGFTITLFNQYNKVNIIKDILHLSKPILGLTLSYFIFKNINDYRSFIKIIITIGLLSAVYHVGSIVLFSDFSFENIRSFGLDNFFELFALLFTIHASKLFEKPIFESSLKSKAITVLLIISNILYLSRTMFIVFIITSLSVYGYTKLTTSILKKMGLAVVFILLIYAYLFSIKIDRNGKGLEPFFYKVKIAPSEIFTTKINRQDHKDLWDHWRGYEAKRAFALMEDKPSSYVFGTGLGSLVNLKFKAPLGEKGMRYISELHNGYVYVFYKTGIFGILCMVSFLFGLYKFIYKKNRNTQHLLALKFISGIGLSYFFTTLVITGVYNPNDALIFILGGLLFFEKKINPQLPANLSND